MHAERHAITIETAANGTATAYLPEAGAEPGVGPGRSLTGRILELIYTKGDFAAGVDFTITAEATGETIWTETDVNASKTVVPGQPTHSTAGVAATFDGTRAVLAPIVLANDRIEIVIASGGDTKSGTFTVVIG